MTAALPRQVLTIGIAGALTLASITGTAGFLLGKYEVLPYGLPVHFRDGQADAWMRKSYGVVLMPLWTQLILAAVIGSIAALLLRRAHAVGPSGEQAQDRHRMLHSAEAMSLLGFVWISFQLTTAYGITELWLNWAGGMGLAYNAGLPTAIVLSIVIGARAMMQMGGDRSKLRIGRPLAIALVLIILLAGLAAPFFLARLLLR